jgi:hypothetical protein
MKKTILLVVGLVLLFSLCGTGRSYAVSAKKAEKAITGVQAYITKWESKGYFAPKAKEILEKARQAYRAGDYKEARKLAEESLVSLKLEVKAGPGPQVKFQLVDPKADLTKYKRIAVLGFNDAPDATGSGNIIANLISSELTRKGYDVIDRIRAEAILGEQKPEVGVIQMGKMLGADAVITGILSQYNLRAGSYFRTPGAVGGGGGFTKGFLEEGGGAHGGAIIPGKAEQYQTATVEVTFEMRDAQTGSILWQGSGSQMVRSTLIQPTAQAVIKAILDKIPQEKAR